MISKELNLGRAGEYIVLADLLLNGIQAFDTGQGVAYDVIAEINNRLIKLQVKTTQKMRLLADHKNPNYFFHLKRAGKNGSKHYSIGDFDAFALVALDRKIVFYLPFDNKVGGNSICIRDSEIKYEGKASNGRHNGLYFQDLTWEALCKKIL